MDIQKLFDKLERARIMNLSPSIILCEEDVNELKSDNFSGDIASSFPIQQKGYINTYLGVPVYSDINLKETKVVVDFE